MQFLEISAVQLPHGLLVRVDQVELFESWRSWLVLSLTVRLRECDVLARFRLNRTLLGQLEKLNLLVQQLLGLSACRFGSCILIVLDLKPPSLTTAAAHLLVLELNRVSGAWHLLARCIVGIATVSLAWLQM